LLAALLASIACGVIGTYVVVKRIVFISGGIAHAAFGGIGLGYFLGINPIIGLIPFSIISALCIGVLSKKAKVAEDTAIGIFWVIGMALGVILIGLTPGYAPDLFTYLFGNILTVPAADVLLMLVLDIIIILCVCLLYKEFLALCFDEEYAQVSGVKVWGIYLLLLTLVALTIVMLVRIVGIILVIALLSIPAAIVKQYTNSVTKMMLFSSIIGVLLTISGLWISYYLNLPSGATIIILSGIIFAVSWGYQSIKYHCRRRRQ
jgi:zinc transport system permease protein